MILTILNRISNRLIIPNIQTHATVKGIKANKLISNLPKDKVRKRKTKNPQM